MLCTGDSAVAKLRPQSAVFQAFGPTTNSCFLSFPRFKPERMVQVWATSSGGAVTQNGPTVRTWNMLEPSARLWRGSRLSIPINVGMFMEVNECQDRCSSKRGATLMGVCFMSSVLKPSKIKTVTDVGFIPV